MMLTAAFFLGLHLPGWRSQGRLWANLTSPVGGTVSICLPASVVEMEVGDVPVTVSLPSAVQPGVSR